MLLRKPFFIAEASSNHGRDLSRALAFVDAAVDAGCDAVKFQLFKIDRMFAPEILAKSANSKVVVIGNNKNGLPLILGQ